MPDPAVVPQSLNWYDSRYGTVRFTFEAFREHIFAGRNAFMLGTREYNREHSHTVMLTEKAEVF
jgi:hypothetical protein